MTRIGRRGGAREKSLLLEFGQNAAEIAGIEIQLCRDLAGAGAAGASEFVEYASLGERTAALEKFLAKKAQNARIEACKTAVDDRVVHLRGRSDGGRAGFGGHAKCSYPAISLVDNSNYRKSLRRAAV